MRIQLIAAGTRMPAWVQAGYREYAKRLPHQCRLELHEITIGKRRKQQPPGAAVDEEGKRMLAAIPTGAAVVALSEDGRPWSTQDLAGRLADWLSDGRDRALLIGGPDGLAGAARQRAELSWSLSPLTLPHGLARVLTAEALYRAWSVLDGHPYHRA